MGTGKYIKQLAGESVIYGISNTISRFIGFFLMPVYTRIFVPSDYGVISLVETMVTLMSIFITMGLDHSSARWFYDTKDTDYRKKTISSWFWGQFVMASLSASVLIVFSRQVSFLLLQSEKYASLISFAALGLPLRAFEKITGNWLRYQRRAWTATVFFTVSSLATIGCTILFVVIFRWSLNGVFSARLVAAAVPAAIALILLRSWIKPSQFSLKHLKPMLAFGIPFIPASLAHWVKTASNRILLNILCDKSEVGLYSIANSISSPVLLFTEAFQLAWMPFAYSILHDKPSGSVYAKVMDVYSYISAILCTGVSIFAVPLLAIMTTKNYYPASSCVPFVAYAMVFNGMLYISGLGAGIAKKSLPRMIGTFIDAFTVLFLAFLLIPRMGKEGAAIAAMISSFLRVLYMFYASQKLHYIPYRFKPALLCFGFSCFVIITDHLFIPGNSFYGYAIRSVLLFLFLPLGILSGILPWKKVVSFTRKILRINYSSKKNIKIST